MENKSSSNSFKCVLSFTVLAIFSSSASSHIDLRNTSPLNEQSLDRLIKSQKAKTIDDLVKHLPSDVKLNFILKHGVKRTGERGHLNEEKVSQSADPHLPRVITWNEQNGFSLSYNGGAENQTSPNRLDLLSFNFNTKKFNLSKVDFPLTEEQIRSTTQSVVKSDSSCVECHGPHQRPIFAMYPDWPAFYGSDNDELNNPHSDLQMSFELPDYRNFKKVSSHLPRYSPLFDSGLVQRTYGMPIWETFPFRPNTSNETTNVSRSFAFRPGLRIGLIYNRLNAQAVFARMKEHPSYARLALATTHSLLQCSWNPQYPKTLEAIKSAYGRAFNNRAQWIGTGAQLSYEQIWTQFGLRVNDIDIRFSYNHPGYAEKNIKDNVMSLGYIGNYHNSYFDGSATVDELLAAHLLNDLALRYTTLKPLIKTRGLNEKYSRLADRYKFDRDLFANYDKLGKWFSIPFPASLSQVHHRESFTSEMKASHKSVCDETIRLLRAQFVP